MMFYDISYIIVGETLIRKALMTEGHTAEPSMEQQKINNNIN